MMKVLRKKRKGGFTLIELIVVIAILGILAAIAIPRLTGFRTDATKASIEANLRTIDSASMVYEADNGSIAADVAALVTANLLQAVPTTTGVTYELSAGGRGIATIAANTFGTHAVVTDLNVEQLQVVVGW